MKVRISTTIEEEEKQELDYYCEQCDITIAQLIRRAIKAYLTKETKKDEQIYSIQQTDRPRTDSSGV